MNKTMASSLSVRFVCARIALSFFTICLACTSIWAQKPTLTTTKIDTLKTPIPIMGATTKRLPERIAKADSTSKMPKKEAIVDNSAPTLPKMAEEATAKSVDKPAEKAAKTLDKTVEKSIEKAPLSKTADKMSAPVVAAPKAVQSAPVVPTQATKTKVNVSPTNAVSSGKMGNCIEFYPNKAVISESSIACLKEMSQFLITNKNLKLNVAASLLPTEKAADAVALKTERAKTIRNYFIQSGVEASRIAVKLTDKTEETPIVLTPQ